MAPRSGAGLAALGATVRKGLTHAEARRRLAGYGPNTLPPARRRTALRRLAAQFASPLVYILIGALAVDVALWIGKGAAGLPFEAVAIAAILALNTGLGAWHEHKAEHVLAGLADLSAPQVWAWRDGALAKVAAAELVPGDLVRLAAGDRVPADTLVRIAERLAADESVLTGESFPVEKSVGSELLAGTIVVRGTSEAEVLRTGGASALGRLAGLLGRLEPQPTPLEKRLHAFGGRVAVGVAAIAVTIAAGGLALEGIGRAGQMALFAAALAVAAVPEGLPAVLALTLALGVRRMARRKALVRRLAAVEALGSVTVIATDKTGTITEGRLEVHQLDAPDAARALRALVLASPPEAEQGGGDPLERALLEYARQNGADPVALHHDHPRISGKPFDAAWSYARATVADGDQARSFLKGAPEVLLARSTLPPAEREHWRARAERHAAHGYRLIAAAEVEGEREDGLRWLGLALLWDPPRAEVQAAVQTARAAGIRVCMITGDHPETARAIARAVGMECERVLTGPQLDRTAAAARAEVVGRTHVFARVTPEQKLAIVEALRADGEVVAVTGDGVNDAPALKRADVGVAMGERGSDVARAAADLVLLDDNFATIVAAVREGRGIYESVQSFLRFLFSTNLSELIVVAVGACAAFLMDLRTPAGALLLPLTAAQLLWINLVSDGAPALALGLDRHPDVMQRRPRAAGAPLLDAASVRFVVLSGTLKAGLALAILWALPQVWHEPLPVAATAMFVFLAAGQLLFVYPSRRSEVRPAPNRLLHAAVAVSFGAQLIPVLVPWLRPVFGTVALPGRVWVLVALSIAVSWALVHVLGRALWRDAA